MRIILPFDRSEKRKPTKKLVGSKCKITFAALPFIHEGQTFSNRKVIAEKARARHFRRVLGLLNHQLPLRDSAGLLCNIRVT